MSLLGLLLYVLLCGVLVYALWWGVRWVGPPEPFLKIAKVIIVVIVVVLIVNILVALGGGRPIFVIPRV